MAPAIGIDLGTSYCSVAVWQKGKVEIITSEHGMKFTPSYVAFIDTERHVGDAAKNQSARNPSNTIFGLKRLIGRRFDDPVVQSYMKQWPFKVLEEYGTPKIEIGFRNEKKIFNAEQISSMILTKMTEIAENYLGQSVKDAVITVPACFNDSQRQATKKAAEISGLNVLRIVNEPTVAALAYGLNRNHEIEKNILIFDLGAGKLDVSVLAIDGGSFFEVKATSGDPNLGGEDFDSRLVDYLSKEFQRIHKQNLNSNLTALAHLKAAAEEAKRTLSFKTEAPVYINQLLHNIDFQTKITRKFFEELCADLFISILEPVEKALAAAKLDKREIEEVVLVGGSTLIPKIQLILRNFFCGKQLNISNKPEEAVVCDAAVYAAILSEESNENSSLRDVLLIDVASYSLGIKTYGGVMTNIIKRNDALPCKQSQIFTTSVDNQRAVTIQVYEGEHAMTEDSKLLGRFELSGIAPAMRGTAKIEITFDMAVDGFMHVTAKDTASGRSNKLTQLDRQLSWYNRINRCIDNNSIIRTKDIFTNGQTYFDFITDA